ncbi:MAG: hypothetical protein DRO87_03620 [Candidatus Thorarchaeota archaeon]|nr:MAG: hypothetical protein DRP09_05815 [Candidatus Thorarchaeota archaeon]RLI59213.1 MAG: hypothetical protein DRO87_03620 [Candidatus Thorarchaeota archaeon]
MIRMQQFLEAIQKTIEVYNGIDGNRYPAWKVTIGFYLALQIVDAYLFKTQGLRPTAHGKSSPPGKRSPDKSKRNDLIWLYCHEKYAEYITLYKLSRKSRYRPEYYHPNVRGNPTAKVEELLEKAFLPMRTALQAS